MKIEASSPADYIARLDDERKEVISRLRTTVLENIPAGFEETISYNMLGYVVPHAIYPDGYHCTPELPLPFLSIASQKNFVAIYHMGIYADKKLLDWFVGEYPKYMKTKLDMGKSCIRFKNMKTIPYELIAQLCSKMSVQQWIDLYEQNVKR